MRKKIHNSTQNLLLLCKVLENHPFLKAYIKNISVERMIRTPGKLELSIAFKMKNLDAKTRNSWHVVLAEKTGWISNVILKNVKKLIQKTEQIGLIFQR